MLLNRPCRFLERKKKQLSKLKSIKCQMESCNFSCLFVGHHIYRQYKQYRFPYNATPNNKSHQPNMQYHRRDQLFQIATFSIVCLVLSVCVVSHVYMNCLAFLSDFCMAIEWIKMFFFIYFADFTNGLTMQSIFPVYF